MKSQLENIGKYQIIKELGKGATSTVYLSLDPLTNRQVANEANGVKKRHEKDLDSSPLHIQRQILCP